MLQEMLGTFFDGIRGITIRLSNADFLPLALAGCAIVLVAYFLFKR